MNSNAIHHNRKLHNFDRYHSGIANSLQRKIRNFFKAVFRMG